MRIFVTGASGWIGSAVVPELLAAGHQVVGLARSDDRPRALDRGRRRGARAATSTISTAGRGRGRADGVIHLALNHDFSAWSARPDRRPDRASTPSATRSPAPTDRSCIASGTLGLTPGRSPPSRTGPTPRGSHPRLAGEPRTRPWPWPTAACGPSVVRLAPTVHGAGDHGFIATLVGIARAAGRRRLRRRRLQPLAGGAPASTRPSSSASPSRRRSRRLGPPRRRRGHRAGDRRSRSAGASACRWPPSRPIGRRSTSAGSAASSAPTFPGVERDAPVAPRLEPRPPRAHRRPRRRPLPPRLRLPPARSAVDESGSLGVSSSASARPREPGPGSRPSASTPGPTLAWTSGRSRRSPGPAGPPLGHLASPPAARFSGDDRRRGLAVVGDPYLRGDRRGDRRRSAPPADHHLRRSTSQAS